MSTRSKPREAKLLESIFIIGKQCREWLEWLQEPAATGLRAAGVHLMGQSLLKPPYLISRPKSRFDALWLLFEGSMLLTLPTGTYTVRPGEVWGVPAGCLARLELPSGKARMSWFHLDAGTLRASLHNGEAVRLSRGSSVVSRVDFYLKTLREPDAPEIRHKLYELIGAELNRLLHPREGDANSPTAARVRQIWEGVEQSVEHGWDVAAMARMAKLSPSRFHALCLEQFGTTPRQKIILLRINRAMSLLLSSDLKLEAIARMCGYSGISAFSKAFEKVAGERPLNFRRRYNGSDAGALDQ